MSTVRHVPTLSLSDFDTSSACEQASVDQNTSDVFVKDFFESISEYGFVIIKDHGISAEQIDRAYSLSKQLFELPDDTQNMNLRSPGTAVGFDAGFGAALPLSGQSHFLIGMNYQTDLTGWYNDAMADVRLRDAYTISMGVSW